jgi:hypothetical protein
MGEEVGNEVRSEYSNLGRLGSDGARILMLKTEVDWNEKRKELTAKRDSLYKQFQSNPSNTQMGQTIKKLDDQVAECEEHLNLQQLATGF